MLSNSLSTNTNSKFLSGASLAHPLSQMFFIFIQFREKSMTNNTSAPSWGWRLLWEILDPPLFLVAGVLQFSIPAF